MVLQENIQNRQQYGWNAFREVFPYKQGGYSEVWRTHQFEQKLEDTIRDVYKRSPLP